MEGANLGVVARTKVVSGDQSPQPHGSTSHCTRVVTQPVSDSAGHVGAVAPRIWGPVDWADSAWDVEAEGAGRGAAVRPVRGPGPGAVGGEGGGAGGPGRTPRWE